MWHSAMASQDDRFGEEGPTIADGALLDSGEVTPLELPRCSECGATVFFDDFTEPAAALAFGLFQNKQCLRSRTTIGLPGSWYWCSQAGQTGKYVAWPPAL